MPQQLDVDGEPMASLPVIPHLALVVVNELFLDADGLVEHIREATKILGKDYKLGQIVLADWLADSIRLRDRIAHAKQTIFN